MSSTRIAAKWSKVEPEVEKLYFGFPALRSYRIRSAFGAEFAERYGSSASWELDILADHYLSSVRPRRVLSLCCGFGALERDLLPRLPADATCLGVDLAPGAIEAASARAAAAGLSDRLEYCVGDLNTWTFAADSFDLVMAGGALHHLSNLEAVADGIWGSLRSGGLFYANEIVGPSYMDHPPRQLELINALAYLVPYRLRWRRGTIFRQRHAQLNRLANGLVNTWQRLRTLPDPAQHPEWSGRKRRLARGLRLLPGVGRKRPDDYFRFGILHDSMKHHLLRTDPSEGVRSAEIIPIFRVRFPGLEVHPYGGPMLLNALDSEFYAHFDLDNAADRRALELMCALEEHYLNTGEIQPEAAILIGRKD